ncbi:MAG: pitrilysin family protein [Candidatus Omnitrophica bacterium]|nr:pitrilysin family protein [Candidatus Omnitrophota bacterium]
MYKRTDLKNKLRVITHEMKDRNSVTIGLWAGVGGRYEHDENKGAAHFLEHILFKGTKNYRCEAIKEEIEGIGGSLNAFTSEECTCYFAKVPSKNAVKTFDVLSDMMIQPLIQKKDVDKERGVILEEIKMYHDLPQHLVQDLLDALLWPGHPLGQNIAGSLKSVGAMSYQDLRDFHKNYYISSNIVVSVCGDMTHSKVLKLVEKKFEGVIRSGNILCQKVKKTETGPKVKFFKKDIEQMHLALGVLGFEREHKDRYALGVLNVILGGNMSSRLFNEVREKRGLAYSISSGAKFLKDTGAFIVRGGVHNEKIVDAVDVILRELKKISLKKIGTSEFKRAKDYLLGQTLLSLEDTAEHMFWLGESIVSTNKVETLEGAIKRVKSVTMEDVQRVAKTLFKKNRMNLAIVGPIRKDQEQKIQSLLGI